MKNNQIRPTSLILVLISTMVVTVFAIIFMYPEDFDRYMYAVSPNLYQDITDQTVQAQSLGEDRLVSINYQSVNVPKAADIQVLSQEDNEIIYQVSDVNLDQRLSYSFHLGAPSGSYILKVSSPTVKTKVMTFSIIDDNQANITIDLGTFNLVSPDFSIPDMNGDGVINSLDMTLFK